MANTFLEPGQAFLVPEVLTDVFTVPANRTEVVTIYIANQTDVATTVRMARAPNGEADHRKHYVLYDVTLPANNTIDFTHRLNQNDVLRFRCAALGEVSVNVWPEESIDLYTSN